MNPLSLKRFFVRDAGRPAPVVRRRTMHAALAAIALGVSSTGCYQYAAGTTGDLESGRAVRLRLSAVAVDRIRQGPAGQAELLDDFEVSGTVGRVSADSIVLSVEMPVMQANVRMRTERRDLALVQADVQRVSLRQLDRRRTTVVGVGAGVASAAIVWAILHAGRATGGLPGGGGTNEVRIPVTVRLSFP